MEPEVIKAEIEALKRELYELMDSEASFKEIYKISVKLDKLVVLFYKQTEEKSIIV